jgi:hypothetical protein
LFCAIDNRFDARLFRSVELNASPFEKHGIVCRAYDLDFPFLKPQQPDQTLLMTPVA